MDVLVLGIAALLVVGAGLIPIFEARARARKAQPQGEAAPPTLRGTASRPSERRKRILIGGAVAIVVTVAHQECGRMHAPSLGVCSGEASARQQAEQRAAIAERRAEQAVQRCREIARDLDGDQWLCDR